MAFKKMCRGWALGTKDFKKALLEEVEDDNELRWEMLLEKGLSAIGKDTKSISEDLKSADWKVTLACLLKLKTSATNVWITQQLNMGTPDAVSRYVSEFRTSGGDQKMPFKELTTKVMT